MRKIVILLCFALIISLSGCIPYDPPVTSDSMEISTPEPEKDPLDDLTVKIKKVDTKKKIVLNDVFFFKPDGKFITFDVQMKNNGSDPVKFYLTDFSAEDSNGNTYAPTCLNGTNYLTVYEVINPNSKYKTLVAFDVSRDTDNIKLKFNGSDV